MKLQQLTLKADSSIAPLNEITADSARFISPSVHSVLDGGLCEIELKPYLPVDSLLVFIQYSNTTDTLGTLSVPPYKFTWDYSKIPDNDQTHLQPGYILYLSSGMKILSPPLPHRWTIHREGTVHSNRKFHSHQTTTPEQFEIDGDIHEWKGIQKVSLGKNRFAKMVWTIGKLYFAAQIEDTSITTADYCELHFDMHNDKNKFADINHRSIRFSPRSRVLFLTIKLTDSGFVPADSVNMLLKEHMEWRITEHENCYIIEAAIPFFCLSELKYPSMKSGFDITIINIDTNTTGATDTTFYSWASRSTLYSRYSPSHWGTLVLHQAMFPLGLTMLVSGLFFSIAITALIAWLIVRYIKEQRIEKEEGNGFSDSMNKIVFCIRNTITDTELSPSTVATQTGISGEKIVNHIQKEAHCSFDYFVITERIKRARMLLGEKEYNAVQVASSTGFNNVDEFESTFKSITGTTPKVFHLRKVQELEEEEG